MTRVLEPVARRDDPLTSYLAGDDFMARETCREAVYRVMVDVESPLTHTDLEAALNIHASLYDLPVRWTGQRIRSACASLVRAGMVEAVGVREKGSPTGRAATLWQVTR